MLAFSLSYSPSSFATAIADLNSWMSASVTWDIGGPNDPTKPLSGITGSASGSFSASGFAIGIAHYSIKGTNWLSSGTKDPVLNTETVFGKAILKLHADAAAPGGLAVAWGKSQGTLTTFTPNAATFLINLSGSTTLSASTSQIGEFAWAHLNLAQIVIDGVVANPPVPTYEAFVYSVNWGAGSYSVGGSTSYSVMLAAGTHTIKLDPVSQEIGAAPEPRILFLLGISIIRILFVRVTRNAQACPISIS